MTAWVVIVLIAILLVVSVGVGVVAGALALSSRRSYRAANEIVPGVGTGAPASWAGAHTPEALLHRQLRDAMLGLSRHPRRDDPSFLDLRVSLEQQALAVDEQLIAVAALPEGHRAEPLAVVTAAIEAVEGAVVALATTMSAPAPSLEQSTAELTERFHLIEEARAELDRLGAPGAVELPAPQAHPVRKKADPDASA